MPFLRNCLFRNRKASQGPGGAGGSEGLFVSVLSLTWLKVVYYRFAYCFEIISSLFFSFVPPICLE